MIDKRTLMAIILSTAVIFAYSKFLAPPPKDRQVQAPVQEAVETTAPAPVPEPPVAPSPEEAAEATAELETLVTGQETATDREIRVVNGIFDITLSSRGAGVTSWKLLDYDDAEGQPLEVAPLPAEGGFYPLSVLFDDPGLSRVFTGEVYLSDSADLALDQLKPQGTVEFSRVDQAASLKMNKKLTFHEGSYMVDLAIEVTNLSGETLKVPWRVFWGPGIGRTDEKSGRFYAGPLTYNGQKVSKVKDWRPKEDGESRDITIPFQWIGVTDRYFLAAFIPSGEEDSGFLYRKDKNTYGIGQGPGPGSIFIPPGGTQAIEGQLFVGPKAYDLLKTYDLGLEESIDFGWFDWLGIPLLKLLKFFYSYTGNYGLAIILMTILIKLALSPVTFTMYKSMRKMQLIQPQIQSIRKKYKDKPQEMNQKTMALYKENKVNPLGGCLPMFIQIPVFFALYKVLYVAIELRGASFLHISDLSGPEPGILGVKVLVVLMGLTMFIQQRLSPTAGDPRQAKFMMFMPVMFTALFWNFASGLVVYFLFSNTLAIGEQYLIKKIYSSDKPAVEAEEKKSSKRKKK